MNLFIDGSPRDEDKNIRDRHFEYGFADDIDNKLQSAHVGVLGSTDTVSYKSSRHFESGIYYVPIAAS